MLNPVRKAPLGKILNVVNMVPPHICSKAWLITNNIHRVETPRNPQFHRFSRILQKWPPPPISNNTPPTRHFWRDFGEVDPVEKKPGFRYILVPPLSPHFSAEYHSTTCTQVHNPPRHHVLGNFRHYKRHAGSSYSDEILDYLPVFGGFREFQWFQYFSYFFFLNFILFFFSWPSA